MKTRTHQSRSPEETLEVASVFAKSLRAGDVVALEGNLGSGKTHFIKGMVRGLGLREAGEVTSPTFVLMHVYKTKIPLYHYDLYRLDRTEDLLDIGFDEFVNDPRAITAIEWAGKADELLPPRSYFVRLEITGEKGRSITITRGQTSRKAGPKRSRVRRTRKKASAKKKKKKKR